MNRDYVLITPCRNEALYARKTLDSVISQSLPPKLWVIVDDGSTDSTPIILADYARRFNYIKVINKKNRGKRSVGPGVIEAFNTAYEDKDLKIKNFTYLCKLDLDLELPPTYFEKLIKRMEANPRIGTCSGKPYFRHPKTGRLIRETCGDEMSVGMTKFYRTACFEQIGGFVSQVMWDGIDCHRCRMFGWIACSWDERELQFVHLRPMGSSQQGIWVGRYRHGCGQYYMGTSVIYMIVSAFYRMLHYPFVIGGLAILAGYFYSLFTAKPRYPDNQFRDFLRRYQWSCLLRGKKVATRRLHENMDLSLFIPSRD